MRLITPLLAALAIASALATPAHADPYKWCAVYGGFGNTRDSCYYARLPNAKRRSQAGRDLHPKPLVRRQAGTDPEDGPPRRSRRS